MKLYLVLFFSLCFSNTIYAQSYTAAVLEYAPQTRPSDIPDDEYVLTNAQRYATFIQQAMAIGANIIVFPEYGLTTTTLPSNLIPISTMVPEPSLRVVACFSTVTHFARFFIDLSCAARSHRIHTVVNLIERETRNDTDTIFFYNTNVVFDADGAVIARYRKINLFNEPQFTPGTEPVTFTAFDVTFGLFTCFDILFKTPAQDVLDRGATDIIYPTAWTSETPFNHAISIQDGYAKAAGVNMLISGYSNVTNGMAGASIHLANATIAVSSLQPANVQNLIHTVVTRVATRTPDAVCTNNIGITPRIGLLPDIRAVLYVMHENMQHYTFQDLELNTNLIQGEVCSEGSDFCCNYHIELNTPLTVNSTVYKMAALFGRRGFQGAITTTETIGVRSCALMACLTVENSSCGILNATSDDNVSFRRVHITASVESNENTFYQPSTLTFDHAPLTNYAYCSSENANVLNVTMIIENPQSLFTFGIFGRVYDTDGAPEGRGAADILILGIQTIIAMLSAYFCIIFVY